MTAIIGTHYSLGQAPAAMWNAASVLGEKIRTASHETGEIPVLCYTGMSGIATASAISLWLMVNHPEFLFYMIYVRKEEEQSHGSRIEHNFPYIDDSNHVQFAGYKFCLAFVDDLVCSGKTRDYVFTRIREYQSYMTNLIDKASTTRSIATYLTDDVPR